MEKGQRKVQMFAAEQVGGFAHSWLKNITVRGILEKSWLADAVQAELAKADLQCPART